MQLLMGTVLLANSIILTMQASEVIELILNLTALFFIQEVDDMAFHLAHVGILSKRIQEDCEKVKNLKRVFPKETVQQRILWKRVLTIVLSVVLFVPFGIIVAWQMEGRYLCKHGKLRSHKY
jgi:hypothetical protein